MQARGARLVMRPRDDDEFVIRIVTVDYYLAKPAPGLDVTESPLTGVKVDRVSAPPTKLAPPQNYLDVRLDPDFPSPRSTRRFPS